MELILSILRTKKEEYYLAKHLSGYIMHTKSNLYIMFYMRLGKFKKN